MTRDVETEKLADAVRRGDRRALARAITLIESTRADHRAAANSLIQVLLPYTGKSVRLGISGVPGVGKSSFIETLGRHVIGHGHRTAVLAVDPSSRVSGGSILGDKTRMETLAREEAAFIRPTPASGTLGGVARRTRESILLCEAAGFDVVVVETVGVGQSETAVKDMTDMFVLLLLPGGGDELQGMKKGIVEIADLILVNKADGEMEAVARHAVSDYRNALELLRQITPDWQVPVEACSALTGAGIPEAWDHVARYMALLGKSGALARRRSEQARTWLWTEVTDRILDDLKNHRGVRAILSNVEEAVAAGRTTPHAAAERLLDAFRREGPDRVPRP